MEISRAIPESEIHLTSVVSKRQMADLCDVLADTGRRNIPDDSHFRTWRRGSLKSHKMFDR
jgi:hypothetical protein